MRVFLSETLFPTSFFSDVIHCMDTFYALLLLECSQACWEKLKKEKKKKPLKLCSFSSVTKLEVKLNKICNRKLAEIKLDQWEKVTLASESQILKATENVSRLPEVT